MASTPTTAIIQISAPTNFPIRLTDANFPVWRQQVRATLIGLDLLGYIDGTIKEPAEFLDTASTTHNPAHTNWVRQDQIILAALLGSCTDTIQPVLSSVTTAADAWSRLTSSYASSSKGRVISLKAKLVRNPRGSRTISEFLQDMKSIADDLALAQHPISDEDLVIHAITQLGDEFHPIMAALSVRETAVTYAQLGTILTEYERTMRQCTD